MMSAVKLREYNNMMAAACRNKIADGRGARGLHLDAAGTDE